MKKFVLGVIVITFLAGSAVYGSGKYADIKPIIEEMAASLEKLIIELGNAGDADAVAAALDNHTKAMIDLTPKMKEILKKHPELKDEKTPPEELKPLINKMEELAKKLAGLYAKIGQYSSDSKVQEASKRWQKAAMAMEGEEKKDEEAKEEE